MIVPQEPETLEQAGLPPSTVEQLIFKTLYYRGDLYGQDLSTAIALKFSVVEGIVEHFKLSHHIQVKRSLGMGSVGAVLSLTESGRARARDHLEKNQYYGPAPVPVDQYFTMVRQQRPSAGWLTKEALAKAFRGMVLTEQILSQIGPAVTSATSLLLYGKPGDGKTYLIESLATVDQAPIFVPYAIECQGNIIQVYDPLYHSKVEEEAPSVLAVSEARSYDTRWVKCRRPFIVSGGELSSAMLDLRFNETSRIYEAPLQLKANNGMYLIDDFGRQLASPVEVLNRWIVPMERRVDYLSFLTGGKMTMPFETCLVFSTNLNPADLGDEAFLRRIQYKMLMRGPSVAEFTRIFENFCASQRLACSRVLVQSFIERHYGSTGRVMRRCHPRDVLTHALHLIDFEKLPNELNPQLLDRAFDSCFLEDNQDEVLESAMLPVEAPQSCTGIWHDKLAQITTAFGSLVFVAGFRDHATGAYMDEESERLFGLTETARVLERQHRQAFRDWLGLNQGQKSHDMLRYLAGADRDAALAQFQEADWVNLLIPPDIKLEDSSLFQHDFGALMTTLRPGPDTTPASEQVAIPQQRPLEDIGWGIFNAGPGAPPLG